MTSPIVIDLTAIPGALLPEPSEQVRLINHRRWLKEECDAAGARARDPDDDFTHMQAAELIEALPEEPRERISGGQP